MNRKCERARLERTQDSDTRAGEGCTCRSHHGWKGAADEKGRFRPELGAFFLHSLVPDQKSGVLAMTEIVWPQISQPGAKGWDLKDPSLASEWLHCEWSP